MGILGSLENRDLFAGICDEEIFLHPPLPSGKPSMPTNRCASIGEMFVDSIAIRRTASYVLPSGNSTHVDEPAEGLGVRPARVSSPHGVLVL